MDLLTDTDLLTSGKRRLLKCPPWLEANHPCTTSKSDLFRIDIKRAQY